MTLNFCDIHRTYHNGPACETGISPLASVQEARELGWNVTQRPTNEDVEQILNGYFPVLDHGFVALVDYMGSDEAIERAARTSYQGGTRAKSKTRGLIRYLRRNLHTSPTEMCELVFHVSMPMFVARQWIRHRTASLNEVSGRYSILPMLFYTPEELRKQSKSNKQGSEGAAADKERDTAVWRWNNLREANVELYEDLLADDVARELARIDLPLSTYTQMVWKIDLHNLLHFLTLRCDSHAQKEIRDYADIIAGIVKRFAPHTFEAWIDYQFAGERMSRMEMNALRHLLEPTNAAVWTRAISSADDVKVSAEHAALGARQLEDEFGMSAREVRDFFSKLAPKEIPDFTLDLTQMKDADYFSGKIAEAVPEAA